MYKPAHTILVRIAKAASDGSDEPAHVHSLARAFAARRHNDWT